MTGMRRYQAYRALMRTSDILEWRGVSLVNRLIRLRTGQIVNHTSGVIVFHLSGKPKIIEIKCPRCSSINLINIEIIENIKVKLKGD